MAKVLFYVQHLLGIGHLRRTATLTRAMQEAGLAVTVVSGGHEIPGLDLGGAALVQLPATRAIDESFKTLVDESGEIVDEGWKAERRERLLAVFAATAPDVVMTELFPFGRRQMRFELLPLLDAALAARPRPAILSSVRDILVAQAKPERNDEMLDLVERYFDLVLVHGDPSLIPFDRTFPHARRIADRIRYTGYVVDTSGRRGGPGSPGHDEVIVSAGGGAVGRQLLEAAIAAKPLSRHAAAQWRVLVGIAESDEAFQELSRMAAAAQAEDGRGALVVERARGDFPTLVSNARLSISQGGYNTTMEVMRARVPAVIVPYAAQAETEQTLRAELLQARRLLHVVPQTGLTPQALAAACDAATRPAADPATPLDTDGGPATARLVTELAAGRQV
ncbi:glycosyltransferase family protein [Marinibaculum pumilum]|uniref:Glycosyltransferase family protein n=1 Tax=Marinibaculum pumilum TaxID=1766165 RepID=A0ABV7KYK4_9PROT